MDLLKLQEKFKGKPFGNRIFSYLLARAAPYFLTIKPEVLEFRANYLKVGMKKRKSVHNHLKTVHAIAICNLCEFAAGICMEASIPKHRRWIPIGMNITYDAKATTDLTTICDLSDVNWDNTELVKCKLLVKDITDQTVATAIINIKVSDKKRK